jgi:hypothetical protein
VPEAYDTTKSGMAAEEAEGGGWLLEVEDDRRKLNRWPECVVEPNCWLGRRKNIFENMIWPRKIGEGIVVGQNGKEKRK